MLFNSHERSFKRFFILIRSSNFIPVLTILSSISMATQADFERIGNYAVMLNPDANIDRHKCKRTVPMEVLHLAFSRTGTLSMQEAYKILGYAHPYHFSEIYGNIRDADMWVEAFNAKYKGRGNFGKPQFDQLLGHCAAITDGPCIAFWKELVEAYPDAKIVLVERDEDAWFRSWDMLLTNAHGGLVTDILAWTDPFWFGRIQKMGHMWLECHIGGRTLEANRRNSRAVYEKHYVEIRESIPKERILEYKLGSGWKPLCEFLGKEVPDVPFPHRNEGQAISQVFKVFAGKAVKNSVINLSILTGICAVTGSLAWRWSAVG